MKNKTLENLTSKELLELQGGHHDDGSGKGCIPNPFRDIFIKEKEKQTF